MSDFIITTDTAADLPPSYVEEHHLIIQPLYYSMEDVVYGGDLTLEPQEFYEAMRNGKMPNTMAINPELMIENLRESLEKGLDILHIAFSSGLSSSYQNAVLAANTLAEDFPDRKIIVVDSKAASGGQGLMVHKALKQMAEGKTMEEIETWLHQNLSHFCHQFTVMDLNHLHRGGRISKTTAVIGTIVNLKPMLHVDEEGKLTSTGVARGRKKALAKLVENTAELIKGYEDQNDEIFICHADCIEDAEYTAGLLKERLGIEHVIYGDLSPTVGSHTGPGFVAVCFYGNKR